ncbi:MAG: 50S ribosomal protein L3 [Clostridiales bacterium]|jgi:large subunit ribosomal protein L3|nr:50S ribosomal protein L3 [Clostridiales bacterium]
MKKAILGRKLGMTQIFDETGLMVPVTVIEAGPMTVIRNKTAERDGYSATVVAFLDAKESNVNKPDAGVFKKAAVKPKRVLKEFKYADSYEVGAEIRCDMFAKGDIVDVSGLTKGHGYTGVIKRWNQHRLKMTHGTGPVHRSRGSMGANSTPSRVIKGLHMAGQYGHENVTIQNLRVVKVDPDKNVILVRGAVPGPKGGLVTVKQAVKKQAAAKAGK